MRRLVAAGVVGISIGIALVLGFQWLTAPGASVLVAPAASTLVPPPVQTPSPAGALPDRSRTPGAINPAATQENLASTVCKPGWASSVRPPAAYTGALKVVQILQYGYADRNPAHYQEDHLVPLELGGAARDPRNLWPQPNSVTLADGTAIRSKQKDDLEDALHAAVCAGTMSLADAQQSMATDWISAWEAAGRRASERGDGVKQ